MQLKIIQNEFDGVSMPSLASFVNLTELSLSENKVAASHRSFATSWPWQLYVGAMGARVIGVPLLPAIACFSDAGLLMPAFSLQVDAADVQVDAADVASLDA